MKLEPAYSIVRALGGAPAVAGRIGRSPSVVYRWSYPKARGGLGGNVPADVRPDLIDLAAELGVSLGHDDFYPERTSGEMAE